MHVSAVDIPLAHGNWLTARYEWDFGDTTATSRFNQLVGWNAGHVYISPGNYAITLTLTDETGEKQVFKRYFVINPDRRRIIYVSSHGNDQFEGDSPEQPVRSLGRVARLLHDDTKVLFRRGDTFDLSAPMDIKHGNIVFGAYDDSTHPAPTTAAAASQSQTQGRVTIPNNPTIFFTGPEKYLPFFSTHDTTADITFQNLTFDSRFNKNTEKTGMPDAIKPAGGNTTVRDCVFLNVGYGINCNEQPRGVMVLDNTCPLETGLRSYFCWVQGSDHVILGNTVANSTREHCLRVGGADRLCIQYNTFSNLDRRDRDKGGDKLDTSKGAMTIHAGNYVYVANNTILHGELLLGPAGKGRRQKESQVPLELGRHREQPHQHLHLHQPRREPCDDPQQRHPPKRFCLHRC